MHQHMLCARSLLWSAEPSPFHWIMLCYQIQGNKPNQTKPRRGHIYTQTGPHLPIPQQAACSTMCSLPPRQPWPLSAPLPAAPRTPGTGGVFGHQVGSTPRGAPQLQTWRPPAAGGVRAWLGEEREEEVRRCHRPVPGENGFGLSPPGFVPCSH